MFSFNYSSSKTQKSKSRFNPYRKRMFDVFISAPRDDYSIIDFSSLLFNFLQNAGVYVFEGDIDRISGELTLRGTIAESRISIIVFTKNYAASTLFLQNLEKIMECRRTMGQQIVPVFYDVDPSEVRKQTGHVGESFASMDRKSTNDENKALSYSTTLQEVAGISPRFVIDWTVAEPYKNIVEHVTSLLDATDLFVADHLVGVESRVQKIIPILNGHKSDDVFLLGIWGMGGIGKTTIAKAIYNQISYNFELRKFLPDLRYRSISLMQEIFSFVFPTTLKNLNFTPAAGDELKMYLSGKRSFFVFDNVNDFDHMIELLGLREWYAPGSRVIITTRNKQVLQYLKVDYIYKVDEMGFNECVELFSWYAFQKVTPERNFAGLIKHVVEYSDGLPLALVALGSTLFEINIEEWEGVLDRLKRFPIQDVQEVLEISFDDLAREEKQIFLELANLSYFFIGMGRNDIIQILKRSGYMHQKKKRQSSGYEAKFGTESLEDQSLVTFDKNNKLRMHPLLQDLGREIYQKQSSTKPQQRTYDVFLSFRGEDTRSKFTSHLHASLENASIYVFKDDDGLSRGEQLSLSLLKAIGESKISIIVLSTNYADSRWCLQELEDIMTCYRTKAQKVLPVFYDVDPSEVRNQAGEFGQAFQDLIKTKRINKDKEQSWRKALREVGSISGVVFLKSSNESEDIKKIVEHVTHMLDMKDMFIANHAVGVESRVQDVIELLKNQPSENPLLLGILGMGGIGKTTIAKAVYNKICREFEGRCFLLNIREVWDQDNGGVRLQEQLLSDIYETLKIKIQNIEFGKSILQRRLREKRILLVLDDVDKLEQLNALVASHEWFCPRTVIIITRRDEHLLSWLRVDKLYRMETLDDAEAIELFSWHAFKEPCPRNEFAQLSSEVISYCGRLPLALEVIGSHLFNREVIEWMSVLEKLKNIPDKQVQKKLKISFDGLSEDEYKEIFLDIAFFFIGMEKVDAINILNGCRHPATIGISVLIEKCLLHVDTKNKLRMHELLRDMGREIIRERSPNAPEKRSRVWHPEEVYDLLSKNMATKAIEGLALKLPRTNPIDLKTEYFKKMKRLKLLQLAGVQLDGDFKYLTTDLRWLCWHGCPSTYTIANFNQGNLVAIDLKYNNLELVWKNGQELSSSGSVLGDCLLPGDNDPNWSTFSSEGFSVFFDVPQLNGRNLKAMMLYSIYSSSGNVVTSEGPILKNVLIENHTKATFDVYRGDKLTSLREEDWQRLISNLEPSDKVRVVVHLGHGFIVKKTIVYLIYEEPIDQNMEHFHADDFVSCHNKTVSGGDDCVVADMNENASDVNDMATYEHVIVSGVHDVVADMHENAFGVNDMARYENVTVSSVNDVVADGNVIASDMPTDNNDDIISSGDENRFSGFFNLHSIFCAVFKKCLFCHHSKKRRKFNRISRCKQRWKWLVKPTSKLTARKKANKAQCFKLWSGMD